MIVAMLEPWRFLQRRRWKRRPRSSADATLYRLSREMVLMRLRRGFTQEQVAACMGTKKSAVSRLERGDGPPRPTLTTIENYALVLGYRVEIRFLRGP